jgi:hypothetical protein
MRLGWSVLRSYAGHFLSHPGKPAMNAKLSELLSADIEAIKVVLASALSLLSEESHELVAKKSRDVAAAYRDGLLFEPVSERYAERLVSTVESLLSAPVPTPPRSGSS